MIKLCNRKEQEADATGRIGRVTSARTTEEDGAEEAGSVASSGLATLA